MITAFKQKAKPDQRIEVKIEEKIEAPVKSETIQTEPTIKEKVEEVKPKANTKFGKGKYRSPYAIDNILKSEAVAAAGEAELLGGEDMPKTPFGQDQVDRHWKLYVQNHIDKKNRSLYTTLNQRIPELKPHFRLVFPIENNVQLNQIDMIKVDLVNYLRKHLNNYALSLELPVKKLASKKHIYTDEEKYKELAKKYPLLEDLREKFDLDLNH